MAQKSYSLEEAWKLSPVGAVRCITRGWYYEVVFEKQMSQGEWTIRPGPTLARMLNNEKITWEETFSSLQECELLIEAHEARLEFEPRVRADKGWQPLDALPLKMYDL